MKDEVISEAEAAAAAEERPGGADLDIGLSDDDLDDDLEDEARRP